MCGTVCYLKAFLKEIQDWQRVIDGCCNHGRRAEFASDPKRHSGLKLDPEGAGEILHATRAAKP